MNQNKTIDEVQFRNELDQQLYTTLKTYFGYDTFRPEQETVIRQILSGRDVFAVMPTGAG